jgi:hypothetical protein
VRAAGTGSPDRGRPRPRRPSSRPRRTYAAYNYKDTIGDFSNIIAQLYMRQALAHLEDEQGWIA